MKPRKYKSFSDTRFWTHSIKAMERIYQNMRAGFIVFSILNETAGIGSDSKLWRNEWQCLQFVLVLILNIDTNVSFELLSKTYQTSVDISPYHVTYNIKKAKKKISQDIKALDALKDIVAAYGKNQFDADYNLQKHM